MEITVNHLQYCKTDKQREFVERLTESGGSVRLVAEEMQMDLANAYRMLRTIKAAAARQGYSPAHGMTHTIPDGFNLKRISSLYNEDGSIKAQWVIATPDSERQKELVEAAIRALAAELPRYEAITPALESLHNPDLCTVYTLSDAHFGMRAWHKENGEADWDLGIAEQMIEKAFRAMIQSSPDSAVGIVNQLGDFLHFDSLAAVTPQSGHLLDADGRYGKIVEAAIRILRRVIDMVLAKHERVHVVMAEGNHDIASSVWLRKLFSAVYENEPRVTVDDSELPYYVYQHGKVMLGFHHGHLKKGAQLPLLFATQFSKVWGATEYRYAHTGHCHHLHVKEHSGMTITQHSTIAARDAYAARGGWHSERNVLCHTYHREFGQVAVNTISPAMLSQSDTDSK